MGMAFPPAPPPPELLPVSPPPPPLHPTSASAAAAATHPNRSSLDFTMDISSRNGLLSRRSGRRVLAFEGIFPQMVKRQEPGNTGDMQHASQVRVLGDQ